MQLSLCDARRFFKTLSSDIHFAAVNASFTLISQSDKLLRLVGDFARGLACPLEADAATGQLRVELPDVGDALLELLDYVALTTARVGVEVGEPLCRVTYRRGKALAEVTIDLRIAAFRLANSRRDEEDIEHEST
jgi:hypothetical protein